LAKKKKSKNLLGAKKALSYFQAATGTKSSQKQNDQ